MTERELPDKNKEYEKGYCLEIRVFSVMVGWIYNNMKDVMTDIGKLFASLR